MPGYLRSLQKESDIIATLHDIIQNMLQTSVFNEEPEENTFIFT